MAGAQSSSLDSQPWLAAPPAATRDTPSTEAKGRDKSRPPQMRLGALAGVGFPRPLSIEGIVKFERVLAFGLEYSTLPQVQISDVHLSCSAIAGSARVFPFNGAFFVGLRAGRQHLDADATVSGYGYSVPVALAVDTTFLNPQVGFLWTWEPGISLGIDAGLQIPLSSQASSSVPSTMPSVVQHAVSPVQNRLENVAKSAGQTVLPTLDLVRVGVLF